MALSVSIPTSVGVPATYWVALSRADLHGNAAISFTMGGFVNQAAFAAGADPLLIKSFVMPLGAATFDNASWPTMYAYAQTLPTFATAISV